MCGTLYDGNARAYRALHTARMAPYQSTPPGIYTAIWLIKISANVPPEPRGPPGRPALCLGPSAGLKARMLFQGREGQIS